MHNYHLDRGPPRCAFKIDIQKAYNTVSWKFLEEILVGFGFHSCMIKWIMACVSSTSFSTNINGNVHGYFKGKCGLRQGDPMSPYLFTLVMEILTVMLKRRVREEGDFVYHNKCSKQKIINICFAHDHIMFAHGDLHSASMIKEALEEFKSASGLFMPIEEGELKRGKDKVLWDDLCLPKSEGGLGHGNGKKASTWFDTWDDPGPLMDQLTYRTINVLLDDYQDVLFWRTQNDLVKEFSVQEVWHAVRERGADIEWYHLVWSTYGIPRHSIHLWIVIRKRLKTQDRLRQWDVGSDVDLGLL
ncbi:putative reverse transcriptase domain, reverse transcriptase zinc-binding domain protein [Tanacetum coccineum]